MVENIIESAVQLLHLVESMKVTVTVTLNAEEDLSVGEAIVLQILYLVQIAVKDVKDVCLVGALLVNAARVSELGTLRVKKTTLGITMRAILVTTNCKKALSIGKPTTYQRMGNMPSGISGLRKALGPGVLDK